ncbi:MAG: hypothetical protein NVSMB18_34650 [Acetobacteraceae bacterium]
MLEWPYQTGSDRRRKRAAAAMRDEQGFTLLEIVIALAIASLALAALTQAVSGGLRATRVGADYQEALSRARSHLEQLGTDLLAGERSGDDGGGFQWRVLVRPVAAAQAPAGGGRPGAGTVATLYGVTVTVGWDTDGGHRDVALTTQRLGLAASEAR